MPRSNCFRPRPGQSHTVSAIFCLALLVFPFSWSPRLEGADPPAPSVADRLVKTALNAELEGDLAARSKALRRAVQVAPEMKLARWHSGQIEVDGQWLSIEQAQRAGALNPRLREYDQLRNTYGTSPEGLQALAQWCAKNGLLDEARINWALLLSLQPANEEALRALDVRWYNGRLLTREQIAKAKEQDRLGAKATHTWKKRVGEWLRQMEGDLADRTAALREIRSLDSPEAIPYLQAVTLGGADSTDLQIVIRRQVSMAFLDALEAMPGGAACEALVGHGVFSPIESVRISAVERLKKRPLHDYVPILLAALQSPIESNFAMTRLAGNNVEYSHELYRRGTDTDWSIQLSRNFLQFDSNGRTGLRPTAGIPSIGRSISDGNYAWITDANAQLFERQSAVQALSIEQRIAAFNQSIADGNARFWPVLVATTEQDFGADPNAWWDWWDNFNDYYSGSTPVYESNYSDSVYCHIGVYDESAYAYEADLDAEPYDAEPPRQRGRFRWPIFSYNRCCCFPRGTPVWTKSGLRPIESLRLGDLVLSQNVDTGEIAYRPVLRNTLRPPSNMLKIAAGGEQIRSTLGHPFWVSGVGWKMAKELEVGNVIHAADLPVRIEATEPVDQVEAFNLTVAEFSTYFVGERGLLVHDNTPRHATLAIVPGFTATQISEPIDLAAAR